MVDEMTRGMVADRQNEIAVMESWLITATVRGIPTEVGVAVWKQISFCREQVELLEKEGVFNG